jgi:phage terminase large subunit-like protein
VTRAEPISALYDQNRVHHVGTFPDLEDQMISFTPYGVEGGKSPDRADALVWALTELFPKMTRKKKPGSSVEVQGLSSYRVHG